MITKKTKLILYNLESKNYRVGTLEKAGPNDQPVCTVAHFIDTVCRICEDVFPRIKDNPLYQNIDWSEVNANKEIEELDL